MSLQAGTPANPMHAKTFVTIAAVLSSLVCCADPTFGAQEEKPPEVQRQFPGVYRSLKDSANKKEAADQKDETGSKSETDKPGASPSSAPASAPTKTEIQPLPVVPVQSPASAPAAALEAAPKSADGTSPTIQQAQAAPSANLDARAPAQPQRVVSPGSQSGSIPPVEKYGTPGQSLPSLEISRLPTVANQPSNAKRGEAIQPIRIPTVTTESDASDSLKPDSLVPVVAAAPHSQPEQSRQTTSGTKPIAIASLPVIQPYQPTDNEAQGFEDSSDSADSQPAQSIASKLPVVEVTPRQPDIEPLPPVKERQVAHIDIEPLPLVQTPTRSDQTENQLAEISNPYMSERRREMPSIMEAATDQEPIPVVDSAELNAQIVIRALPRIEPVTPEPIAPEPISLELTDYRYGSSPVAYGAVRTRPELRHPNQFLGQPSNNSLLSADQYLARESELKNPSQYLAKASPKTSFNDATQRNEDLPQMQAPSAPSSRNTQSNREPIHVASSDPRYRSLQSQEDRVQDVRQNQQETSEELLTAKQGFENYLKAGAPQNVFAEVPSQAEGERLKKAQQDIDRQIAEQGFGPYQASPLSDEIVRTTDSADGTQLTWAVTPYGWSAPNFYHRPLYFEEVNLERYGHRKCFLQPALSCAHFFATIPVLPYKMGAYPPNDPIYVLGHGRPGSRQPHQRHGLPMSARGAVYQGVATTGLVFLLP